MERYTFKKGGHFNFPIYTEPAATAAMDASGVTSSICNNFIKSFEEHNTNKVIPPFANFITGEASIGNNSYKNIFLLHDFLNKFTNPVNCNIGDKTLENIILLDQSDNVAIYKIRNNVREKPENIVYFFKLNNNIHIEFVGTKQYEVVLNEDLITNFDKEYKNNFNKSREEFSMNTLYALNTNDVFINIFNKYNLVKEALENYLKDFCRILKNEQGVITHIEPLSKDNIIHVVTFMNKMIEFIRMINLNYVDLNNNELYPEITGITKVNIEQLIKQLFEDKFINNGITKKTLNSILKFKDFDNLENIPYKIMMELIEKKQIFINDLKLLLKCIYVYKNGDYKYSMFSLMLNIIILLNDSGFINIENHDDLNNIINKYIYIENIKIIENIESKDSTTNITTYITSYITSLKKTINKEKYFHFNTFLKVMIKFFQETNKLREKFIENNLVLCNEVIKSIVLKTYVHYLNLQNNDILFPVSVKTHINKFNKLLPAYVINSDYEDLSKTRDDFIISPDGRIVYKEYSFPSCGESTLLNLLRYMLFDKEQHKITTENIQKLKGLFPDNLLTEEIEIDGIKSKKIFDIEELKDKNNKQQTQLLKEQKLNDFAVKIYAYKNEKIYNKGKICEIKPNFINSMAALYFLLTRKDPLNPETVEPINLNVFIIDLMAQFDKRCELILETELETKLNCDDEITVHFTIGHGYITRNRGKYGEKQWKA